MSIDNIKLVVRDRDAKLLTSKGVEGKSADMVIRYWENVDAYKVEEAIEFLRLWTSAKNTSESMAVHFLKADKTGLEGLWRGGEVSMKRSEDGVYTIFQELHKGFVQTVTRQYTQQVTSNDESPSLTDLRLYDSGANYEGNDVYYGENEVYARWTDPTLGNIITIVGDIGEESDNIENYFSGGYPSSIVVAGLSQSAANGTYNFDSFSNGRPKYIHTSTNYELYSTGSGWRVFQPSPGIVLNDYPLNTDFLPPKTGWNLQSNTTLTYTVDTYSSTYFGGYGDWSGVFSIGAIAESEVTLEDFINHDGHLWKTAAKVTVLRLPNVDPHFEEDIRYELKNQISWTDPAIKYETISETNYYLDSRPLPEEDGSLSILLFLTTHLNQDLYFHYQATNHQINGHYYKFDTTEALIETLLSTELFDIYGKHSSEYTDTTATAAVATIGLVYHQTDDDIYYEAISNAASTDFIGNPTVWRVNTLSTMQEKVVGRTVVQRRLTRDESDMLFDLNIDLVWIDEHTQTTARGGLVRKREWSEIHMHAQSLPTDAEMLPLYDIPTNYENTTDTGKTPVLDAVYHQTSTNKYYLCIKADSSSQLFTNTTYWEERLFDFYGRNHTAYTDTAIDITAAVTGELWHHTGDDKYYEAIATGTATGLADTDYFVERVVQNEFGLWSVEKQLTGPSGSGLPVLNDDDTYDYSIVFTRLIVADNAWQHFGPDFDHERKQTRQHFGLAPYRYRIGGDLEFNEDEDGELVGVMWNNNFDTDFNVSYTGRAYGDTTTPDFWEAGGYLARYGTWQPQWEKHFLENHAIRNGGIDPLNINPFMGSNTDATNNPVYVGVEGHVFIANVSLESAATYGSVTGAKEKDVWFVQETGKFHVANGDWNGGTAVALSATATPQGFTQVDPADVHKLSASGGLPGMPGKIATREEGDAYPTQEVDKYISILKEQSNEVLWNNDWDSQNYYGTLAEPDGWSDDNYDDRYGSWDLTWRKSFTPNYLTRNGGSDTNPLHGSNGDTSNAPLYRGTSGNVFIATVATAPGSTTVQNVKEGDVWYSTSTNSFYEANADGTTPGTSYLLTDSIFDARARTTIQTSCPGMPGKIGISGSGTYPEEEVAQVGVIDGSGGNALSTSARVSLASNITINPQVGEVYECIKRAIGSINFFTYFPFDPQFLPEANRRIPIDFASAAAAGTFVEKMNRIEGDQIIPITVNAADSNFAITHKVIRVSDELYAIKLTITLRDEWETDEEAQDAIIAMYDSGAAGKSGNKVLAYKDLTGVATKPWSGNYLDIG